MKKLKDLFTKNVNAGLDQYSAFEIRKEESDALYGGFKEYKPPIYEPEESTGYVFKPNDLLIDINQKK